MEKPTVFFVPGAWLPLRFYSVYLESLEKIGYPTTGVELPSLNPSDPSKTDVKADTDAVVKALTPLVDSGKDVILVMHSYGGMPGAAAAKGLSIDERKLEGKSGGVIGLLMIAAFVVQDDSLAGRRGGTLPPWIVMDQRKKGCNMPKQANTSAEDYPKDDIFAADYSKEEAKKVSEMLQPHATLAFNSLQPAVPFADAGFKGRLAYQVTVEDKAVPLIAQDKIMDATGEKWIEKRLHGSHLSPFGGKHLQESVDQFQQVASAFEELASEKALEKQ